MTDLRITPSPWAYKYGEVIGNEEREVVCEPLEDADAHLIAAAPEGFDVVNRFRQKLATYVSVYPGDKELRGLLEDCDAYLAKARGLSK